MAKITWGNAQPKEMFKGIKTIDEVASKLGEIGFVVKSWENEEVSGLSPYEGDFFMLFQTYDITDCEGVNIWVKFYYGDKSKEIHSICFYKGEQFNFVDFKSDSKEEKDKGKKKAVSIKEVENLFFEKVNERDIANKLYEFALNIKENIIEEINAEHDIVDENGEIFDGSDDDTEWYDDIEHEALDAIYDKISETLSNSNL